MRNRIPGGKIGDMNAGDKVYLAMPYSHPSDKIMERRFEAVTRIAASMAEDGLVVFSPITHSHVMSEKYDMPTDWEFWKEQDIPFIDWADHLCIVTAKGWKKSTGVTAETEYAEDQDIPVRKVSPLRAIDIVGISGKKRSGKDSMANILAEEEGYEKYSLADPIKEACREIFCFDDDQLYGDRKEVEDPFWEFSARDALQVIGTDIFRKEYGGAIWMRSLQRRLGSELPEQVVIPDVRFPNEVETIQDWGGQVVRIDASERLDSDDQHASETALDDYPEENYDYVLDNNGTIGDFDYNVDKFIKNNL